MGEERELLLGNERFHVTPYFTGGAHGVERAGDKLRGARTLLIVGRLRLEELGVRQVDPELVVQAMKERLQIDRLVHRPIAVAHPFRSAKLRGPLPV